MSNQQLAIKEKRDSFLQVIQGAGFKKQLGMAIPKHMTADRMLRVVLTAMNRTPALFDCDRDSVMAAMMDCSALGLEPDGRNAYLIPFNDKRRGMICQLIIGYQGFIDLAYRHPLVRGVRAKAVYEKDYFEYDEGLHPVLVHRPYDGADEDAGALKYAYAICNIGETGSTFVVLNRRQVMKAKGFSRGADSQYSPWNTSEEAMWVKTAVRALAKFMPKSSEMAQALSVDDTHTGAVTMEAMTIPTGSIGNGGGSVTELAAGEAAADSAPAAEEKKEEKHEERGPTAKELLKSLIAKGTELNAGKGKILKTLIALNLAKEGETLDAMDAKRLANILDAWEEIAEKIKNPE